MRAPRLRTPSAKYARPRSRVPAERASEAVGWVEFLRDPTMAPQGDCCAWRGAQPNATRCWVSQEARPNLRLLREPCAGSTQVAFTRLGHYAPISGKPEIGSRGVYPRAARSADPGARASALAALARDTRACMPMIRLILRSRRRRRLEGWAARSGPLLAETNPRCSNSATVVHRRVAATVAAATA